MATKTFEYDIEGNYGSGWELVTCEETLEEAHRALADYRKNEPTYRHRIRQVSRQS